MIYLKHKQNYHVSQKQQNSFVSNPKLLSKVHLHLLSSTQPSIFISYHPLSLLQVIHRESIQNFIMFHKKFDKRISLLFSDSKFLFLFSSCLVLMNLSFRLNKSSLFEVLCVLITLFFI